MDMDMDEDIPSTTIDEAIDKEVLQLNLQQFVLYFSAM
jgi:hypothetical protein